VPLILATSSLPPALTPAEAELERQVLDGGRFVVFQFCISVLVLTFKRSSPIIFLRGDEDGARHALTYSLISLVAGWWGIPWGPIWTISTVSTNLQGGKDLTKAVLDQKLGPVRASQVLGRALHPAPKGSGLKALRWGVAGAGLLLVLAFMALVFGPAISGVKTDPKPLPPGQAQFNNANRQINTYQGGVAFGNSPKAVAVAERFSSSMKKLRQVMFEGSKQEVLSVSHHEFLTCCELQENQCALIVHVPELRRFSSSAKQTLGTLAWVTAQQALQGEQAGKPGMKIAVGLRGIALYDRVLIGTFDPEAPVPKSLTETVTGSDPEQRLHPWFQSPPRPPTSPANTSTAPEKL
jgi:hypothetical protein